MTEMKKGIGWKPPTEIVLSDGSKVTTLAYLTPPAFYCLKQVMNDQTKEFDEKLFTKEILQYFLRSMVIEPVIDEETFRNSDMILLTEIMEKILTACNFSKKTISNLKPPPTKP